MLLQTKFISFASVPETLNGKFVKELMVMVGRRSARNIGPLKLFIARCISYNEMGNNRIGTVFLAEFRKTKGRKIYLAIC